VEHLPRFRFAVKASRYITHFKKLRDADDAVARFFRSGVLLLGDRLGPILWQLPPQLAFDERVAAFVAKLPRTAGEIGAPLGPGLAPDAPLVHVFEPRGRGFDELAHRVATDGDDAIPPGPVGYVRLHGAPIRYASRVTDEELRAWARRARAFPGDVYVFFDNDARGHAPRDAMRLADLV
jgi:uncharacterized protein YecE (DUF72 family)